MAKSSAAPANEKLEFVPEELCSGYHVAGRGPSITFQGKTIAVFRSGPSKAVQDRAESYARLFIRTADSHQALYEALSALTNLLQKAVDGQLTLIDSRYAASGYGGKTVTENIHAARAALALADAAQGEK